MLRQIKQNKLNKGLSLNYVQYNTLFVNSFKIADIVKLFRSNNSNNKKAITVLYNVMSFSVYQENQMFQESKSDRKILCGTRVQNISAALSTKRIETFSSTTPRSAAFRER